MNNSPTELSTRLELHQAHEEGSKEVTLQDVLEELRSLRELLTALMQKEKGGGKTSTENPPRSMKTPRSPAEMTWKHREAEAYDQAILETVIDTDGNQSDMARILGISR